MDKAPTLLMNGNLTPFAQGLRDCGLTTEYQLRVLNEISPEDINTGYAYLDNDICVNAIAAIGQYIRTAKHEDADTVIAAPLCHDCRSCSLARLLRLGLNSAGLKQVRIKELTEAELHAAAPPYNASVQIAAPENAVGIFGPIPVLITPEFNHTVLERLRLSGLHPYIPDLTPLLGCHDVFSPALAFFSDQGVRAAIGILPFGCMSGNAYARGQLRVLQKRYPDMQITLIDYDPSASDINTVNRIELVIQSILGT